MAFIFNSRAHKASRVFLILLAVLYLGVFVAHDLIFEADLSSCSHHVGTSFARSDSVVEFSVDDTPDHYCPFCDGFIDSSSAAEVPDYAGAVCCVASTSSQPVRVAVWPLSLSRAPPSFS